VESVVLTLQGQAFRAEVAPDFVPGLSVCFRGNTRARAGKAPGIRPDAVLPWLMGEASDAKPHILAWRTPGFRYACPRSFAEASRSQLRPRLAGLWCGGQPAGVGGLRGFPYNNALVPTVSGRSRGSVACGPAAQGRR